VRHDIAEQDQVVPRVRDAGRVIPETGTSGVDGFSVPCYKLEEHRFASYGHSTFFEKPDHCQDYWLPFLRDTQKFKRRCDDVVFYRDDRSLKQEFAADYFPIMERYWQQVNSSYEDFKDAALVLLKAFIREGRSGRYNEESTARLVVQGYLELTKSRRQ
jgi:hypothetical protein